MGTVSFITSTTAPTAAEAFGKLVEEALYSFGHGGYTGTIAEKTDAYNVTAPDDITTDIELVRWIEQQLDEDENAFFQDKWGPAAYAPSPENPERWYFFGRAPI